MSIPVRILTALIVLRLLVPPGICLCKATAPAAALLARAFGQDAPLPVEDHDDHHHHDGCPSSPLAAVMGLQPAGPSLDAPAPCLDALPDLVPAAIPMPSPLLDLAFPIAPPPRLSGCVLVC